MAMTRRDDLRSVSDLLQFLDTKVDAFHDRLALQIKETDGWLQLTYAELRRRDRRLAGYLQQCFPHAQRVAILSESRPEWVVGFYGAARAGKQIVPLDNQLGEQELVKQVQHSETGLILASQRYLKTAKSIAAAVSPAIPVLNIQDPYHQNYSMAQVIEEGIDQSAVQSIENGPDTPQDGLGHFEPQPVDIDLDELAMIVYTSGTTGQMKGVMLSYRNLFFQTQSMAEEGNASIDDRFLSILPLNHMLELSNGLFAPFHAGASVTFCHSLLPHEIIALIKECRITSMVCVPLFLRTLKRSMEKELTKLAGSERLFFQSSMRLAKATQNLAIRRKILAPIHRKFGGRLKVFFTGGAAIEMEIIDFFHLMGIHVVQGYGMTETAPVITTNNLQTNRPGSVGRPMPGIDVKIDSDNDTGNHGEILAKGDNNMLGYYQNADLTKEVMTDDGYIRTGDLGYLDPDGYLYITGRKKNLIVLGGGKKIHPEQVETELSLLPWTKDVAVLGMPGRFGNEEVWIVITVQPEWETAVKGDDHSFHAEKDIEVRSVCRKIATYIHPQKIIIRAGELEKSTTRKVKINVLKQNLLQEYKEETL